MDHNTEGITIPADKPQRAMTRVYFRGLQEFPLWQQQPRVLRRRIGKGAWHSRRAKVRCHLCTREREKFIKDSGELYLGRVRVL